MVLRPSSTANRMDVQPYYKPPEHLDVLKKEKEEDLMVEQCEIARLALFLCEILVNLRDIVAA